MDRIKLINDWYKHKLDSQPLVLKSPVEVTEEYHVHTGGRSIHGKVRLLGEPNDTFYFTSLVTWPDKGHEETYDKMVMHGVIDVLLTYTDTPILGVSIVLQEVGWHDVDSCAIGYYKAARKATEMIIHPSDDTWNYN